VYITQLELEIKRLALREDIHVLGSEIKAIEDYLSNILWPRLQFAQAVVARAAQLQDDGTTVVKENVEIEQTSPAVKAEKGWSPTVLKASLLQERGNTSYFAVQQTANAFLAIYNEQLAIVQRLKAERVEKIRLYADLRAQSEINTLEKENSLQQKFSR
jgi:hypothetical protein